VLTWDDERVASRRRIDIHETDGSLILGDDQSWNLAGDD
jgi:hypothetical protein